jgi:hypothetical protein
MAARTPDPLNTPLKLLATQAAGTEVILRNVIRAWEKLPGGQNYDARRVERWLRDDMKPAIDGAREHLGLQTQE